jgi:hypothetical protein
MADALPLHNHFFFLTQNFQKQHKLFIMFSKFQTEERRKRVLDKHESQYQYFTHLIGHIYSFRERELDLKFRIENEMKRRFNFHENTTEEEFNSLHQNVSLDEIHQAFVEVEMMEHLHIEQSTPTTKKNSEKSTKK